MAEEITEMAAEAYETARVYAALCTCAIVAGLLYLSWMLLWHCHKKSGEDTFSSFLSEREWAIIWIAVNALLSAGILIALLVELYRLLYLWFAGAMS